MAYTKYSLTPANNTATPPDGAPEGMLPSAVNDTMRDMMAQIRDVGDGIRNGTYTMTAPVITGGSITGVALSGNTFTNPVITGGSINNTPIGASTTNTGAFTTLSASGVATFSAGTVSAPALTTTGDTNTGIFFPAADTIAFTEGGVESMRIDSSGNVGIGTSSPSTQLHMTGSTFRIANDASNIQFYNTANSVRSGYIQFLPSGATQINVEVNQALLFATNNTERMRITSGGVVGIGSTSPVSDRALTLNSTSNYFGIAFQTSGTTRGQIIQESTGNIYVDAGSDGGSGALICRTTGTERMRITSGGDVGIGITSPGARLDVNPASGTIFRAFTSSVAQIIIGNGGTSANYYDADTQIFRSGNATERMRIDSSGNVLVGKTSFSDTVVGIQLPNSGLPTFTASSSTSGASTLNVYSTGASAYRFYVNMAGTVFATSTTITGISDQRLKENIVDLPDGLDAVMALKPRKFDWKEGKGKNIKGDRGFIAQEFETVFPDMIETWKDPAPEGEEPYKGVNPNLIPTLVKAIQEQQAMIEELKQEVAALKAK